MSKMELTDDDREEILRLVLAEADGTDVAGELGRFPADSRSLFRKVVIEAGLVDNTDLVAGEGAEQHFTGTPSLTPRGRRRLAELNARKEKGGGMEEGR